MNATDRRARALSTLVIALLAATMIPILAFRYLPLTDFPQHLAVATILDHVNDPKWGFEPYYEIDFGRTLYVLPYVLVHVLGKIMSLEVAQRLVMAIAVASMPLGIFAVLRATKRPPWLALFAAPAAYNRAFFFGFQNFMLGMGLALFVYALLASEKKWSARRAVLTGLLAVLSAITHVYGLAFVFGVVALHFAFGDRAIAKKRAIALVPAAILAVIWSFLGARAPGYGAPKYPGVLGRIPDLFVQILGGYVDWSEPAMILAVFAAFAWLLLGRDARQASGTNAKLSVPEKTGLVLVFGNLLLYFFLPESTLTAKLIHFRHAVLAFALLPLAMPAPSGRATRILLPVALALSVFSLGNAGFHFAAFDREARQVEPVLDALPERPKVVSLIFDRNGAGVSGPAYIHFAAYGQARKGGIVGISFPHLFWNLPVRAKVGAELPKLPADFEWQPQLYDDRAFGYFYDYALARGDGVASLASKTDFPFDLVTRNGPWQLYRRRPARSAPAP